MTNARGIDASRYDVKLNWSNYNWEFAFIKVSEGTVIDSLFKDHWKGAKGHTLRSPYHFFRPSIDPKQSVQKTIEYLGNDRGELPLMLDLEATDGRSDVLARAKSWLSWYEQLTGVRPIVYSSEGFLADNGYGKNQWLGNYKLHLAQWRYDNLSAESRTRILHEILTGTVSYSFPLTLSPFKQIPFVQWTAKGNPADVPGYYTGAGSKLAVDFNFYKGTLEQLKEEFGVIETPQPPQEEDVTKDELIAALLPIYTKMDEIISGIKGIAENGGTVNPPVTTTPSRTITTKGTTNRLVPTYDMPDVNSTKCTFYQPNNTPKESVPPAGHKGMPKEPDILEREIHARNLFKDWAWLPKQVLKKANGNLYAFPDVGLQGQDIDEYPGMWIPRSAILTPSPDSWIESIIVDLKKQWGVV